MILILFGIWLLFSVLSGIMEALADAGKYNYKYKHSLYTAIRFVVGSVFMLAYLFYIGCCWTPLLFAAVAFILGFSFSSILTGI